MVQRLKTFINKMNQFGIPLPMLRDPKTGVSSVSLTMMMSSFVICSVGLIGKLAGQLDINLGEALTLFGVTASLYFGRNLSVSNRTPDSATTVQGDTNQ